MSTTCTRLTLPATDRATDSACARPAASASGITTTRAAPDTCAAWRGVHVERRPAALAPPALQVVQRGSDVRRSASFSPATTTTSVLVLDRPFHGREGGDQAPAGWRELPHDRAVRRRVVLQEFFSAPAAGPPPLDLEHRRASLVGVEVDGFVSRPRRRPRQPSSGLAIRPLVR